MATDPDCWECQEENKDLFAALEADLEDDTAPEPDPRGTKVRTWRGLLAPIGKPTGDGRRFAAGALTHGNLPDALRWQREDGQGHSRAVAIGTLEHVEYTPEGSWGMGLIFDPDPEKLPRLTEDVNEALMLLDQGVIGPSVDLDSMEFHALAEPVEPSMAELAAGEHRPETQKRPEIMVDRGRIRAATLVQIPAFAECGPFELGEMEAEEYAAQVQAWAAEREEMDAQVEAFSALAGTFGAEDLDDMEQLLAGGTFGARFDKLAKAVGSPALAAWIGRKKYGAKGMAKLAAGAPAKSVKPLHAAADMEGAMVAAVFEQEYVPPTVPADWFRVPEPDKPTPLTVTDDGRVFGHIADWKTCHTGFSNQCVRAPKSPSGYAYFHTGVTRTDEGDLPIGKITVGTGHADLSFSHRPAAEHYDNSGAAVAEGRAVDGRHGIWFSGRVIPGTDPERVAELRRSPLSGDWRPIGGKREMIAALAVNSGGFPIPRQALTAGAQLGEYEEGALVAAGVLQPETAAVADPTEPVDLDAMMRRAFRTIRAEEHQEGLRGRAQSVFAKMDATEEAQEPVRRKQRALKAASKATGKAPGVADVASKVSQTQTGATGLAYSTGDAQLDAAFAMARRKRRPVGDGDADDRHMSGMMG